MKFYEITKTTQTVINSNCFGCINNLKFICPLQLKKLLLFSFGKIEVLRGEFYLKYEMYNIAQYFF